MIYVMMYLIAIVLANVTIMMFGPTWSIVNAFLFIGFNLTARDHLHDAWRGNHLKRNMFLLILAGSAISFAAGAGRIAVASFLAFAISETIDAITYQLLRNKEKLVQINGSNVVSALADSIIFPALAFGFPLMFGIMAGQFAAKVLGGAFWSLALRSKNKEISNEDCPFG